MQIVPENLESLMYPDDVIVGGEMPEAHVRTIRAFLSRLRQ